MGRRIRSGKRRDAKQVLLVNMTSVRPSFHDAACVINSGEHPFVKHATYMNYRDSKIVANSDLDQRLSAGQIILEDKVSDGLLQRIREGAAQSEFIPLQNKQLLIDQGFIT